MVREIGGSMAPLWSSLVEPGKTQAKVLPLFSFCLFVLFYTYVDHFVTSVLTNQNINVCLIF
jgi:hypothetical protein